MLNNGNLLEKLWFGYNIQEFAMLSYTFSNDDKQAKNKNGG